MQMANHGDCCACVQDTIEAFLRMPDMMKSLSDIVKKVKDASRLLARLQVSHLVPVGLRHANVLPKIKLGRLGVQMSEVDCGPHPWLGLYCLPLITGG